jgi:membrane-bound lytic murein transglycosylase D
MKIFAALFFAGVFPVAAQPPQVPHKMEFAGITLTIRDDARREIQKDVDALTQSPRHYNIKAERAKTYFPIIEKIFQEEQVPDDFKYLSLQESALIADAVSSSNAVGFWQFKDFTAIEMGLRVDKVIDERQNIVSASRAAARYIKKNNTFFDNWIYALQAYQMGAGGVLKTVQDNQSGAKRMEINSHTYWYVKKFLAHKIAYEQGVKGKGQVEVLTYQNSNGRSLADLAKEVSVDETALRSYNKWSKTGFVPADRTYVVLVPLEGNKNDIVLSPSIASYESKPEHGPSSPARAAGIATMVRKKVNGIQTIQALQNESSEALASRAGVELSKLLKWNDLSEGQALIPGQFYFLARKRVRAIENFHKVGPGENLWSVSQRYGVQLKKLMKYNRLDSYTAVSEGTMLWLASTRPKTEVIQEPVENAVGVSSEEVFNWQAGAGANGPAENKDTVMLPAETVKPPVQTVPADIGEVLEQEPSDSVKILQEPVITETSVSAAPDPGPKVAATLPAVRKATHTVQPKETLYAIARMYNIGVMDLVNWNDLDLQQGIKPGQVLKLTENQPVKNEPAPEKILSEQVHEVKSSDTLYSIARQYGVTIKEIMDWNEKKDFSLAVGEKLKIHQRQ